MQMAISDGSEPPNLDWPSVTKVQSCRGRHQTLFPPLCGKVSASSVADAPGATLNFEG
jgi:hypothetical protein